MAIQNAPLLSFNRGLVSKLALARTDLKRMALSAEEQTNWMPRVLGSMSLRPGMQYIGGTNPSTWCKFIPFIKAVDDTALVELTTSSMRVWVSDALVTRVSVTTSVTNGTFAGNITGWTDASEAGATTAYTASFEDMDGNTVNCLGLTGTGNARAISRQTVTCSGGNVNKEHALKITIARGPVTLKIGTADGDDSYIAETTLLAGHHSLAFTPTGNFHIEFSTELKRLVCVSNCTVEAAGTMVVATPWITAPAIDYDESADVIFLATGGKPMRIERRGTHSWSLVYDQPEDGPFRTENVTGTTISASAKTGEITLTASEPLFKTTHKNALFRIASIGQDVTATISGADEWSDPIKVTGQGQARNFSITISGSFTGTIKLQQSVAGIGAWTDVSGESWTAAASASYNDQYDNQIIYYRIGSANLSAGSASVELNIASGSINGIVHIKGVASSTSATAYTLSDLGNTTASAEWWEGVWSDYRGWPTAVCLHEGRLGWFGSDHIILSVSDAFDSFDDTTEGDSGPIIRSIGKGPVDTINGALSLQRLVLFGEYSEKSIRASSLDEVLTPSNFNIRDCSTQGSSRVKPVVVDQAGFFVQRSGRRVFRIDWQGFYSAVDYMPTDMTSIDPDIGLDGGGFTHLAVQRQPDTRVHALLADGTVAVLVYDNAEEAQAWVKVVFGDGTLVVEDIVVLPGEIEDQVYYVISNPPDIYSTVRWLVKWAREDQICPGENGGATKLADAYVVTTPAAACPNSQKGTITFWINPIGARANETQGGAAGDGTANHWSCEADDTSQNADGYIRGWAIDFTTKKVGDVFVPDKFSVTFDFEDLFTQAGDYVQKYIVSAGKFSDGSNYIDLPADGFPLMFTWDFSGNTWGAQIWMGKSDGTVVQIDNTYNWKYETGGDGGPATTGTTATMGVGSPLATDQHLFDGASRTFYLNFGTSFNVCTVVPPPDPLPNTQLWHTCEYAQCWLAPGQLLDPSTALASFYDSTSTPKWAPKNIGSDGSTPTGLPAFWYFNGGTTTDFNLNRGSSALNTMATYCVESGLDFATCVPATAASTIPASGSYQAVGVRFGINDGSGVVPPTC